MVEFFEGVFGSACVDGHLTVYVYNGSKLKLQFPLEVVEISCLVTRRLSWLSAMLPTRPWDEP